MPYLGKLVGVILGIMLTGKLFGAIAGFILGSLFDKHLNPARHVRQQATQQLFFHTTFQIMGHLSKASGQVTENNIQVASNIMKAMHLDTNAQQTAQQAFRQGKATDFPLREKLRELRRALIGRTDLLRLFMEFQVNVAFADGSLHPNQHDMLLIIADELGISRHQFGLYLHMRAAQGSQYHDQQSGYTGYNQLSLADALNVLGVKRDDQPAIIKRAYRRLMNEHHPDKLVAKGLPPEMIDIAKEKAQNIQAAYDLVKRELGFK